MSQDTICDTEVSVDLLQEMLQGYFRTSSVLVKCQGTVISKGMGFTSQVIRTELQWLPEDQRLPSRVIVKAPSTTCIKEIIERMMQTDVNNNNSNSEPARIEMPVEKMIQMIHKAEFDAYTVLQMAPVSPVPIPKIFGMSESQPSVIVLEDLGERATTVANIADGLSLAQWRAVADALADLHGWSLTTSLPWRQFVRGQETIMLVFKEFMDATERNLVQTRRKFGAELGPLDDQLFKSQINMERMMANYEWYRTILPDVMTHGDTWINNVMFERDGQEAGAKIAAFIDWQICFEGCGLNDLARLSTWCVDPQLRRDHEQELLERYLDRLKSVCAGKAPGVAKATVAGVGRAYEHACAVSSLMCVTMLDFMLDCVAKVADDPTGWRRQRMLSRARFGYERAEHFLNSFTTDG